MTEDQVIPCIGDIWQEADPRFERYVEITGLDSQGNNGTGAVQILTVYRTPETIGWKSRGGYRWAKLTRFNGKRGGYKLHIRSTLYG